MSQDIYLESKEGGEQFPLTSERVTIGRTEENDLTFAFAEISSHHAVLFKDEEQWYLEDLGSTNGTFVNSVKLSGKIKLQNGDGVRFGRPEYTFHCPAEKDIHEERTMVFENINEERTVAFDIPSPGSGSGASAPKEFEVSEEIGDFPTMSGKVEDLMKYVEQQEKAKAEAEAAKGDSEFPSFSTSESAVAAGSVAEEVVYGELHITGGAPANSYRLTAVKSVIGKAPDCDVLLHANELQDHHAQIIFMPSGKILAKVLHPGDKVGVNGQMFQSYPVNDGDTIQFGGISMKFDLVQMPQFDSANDKPATRAGKIAATGGAGGLNLPLIIAGGAVLIGIIIIILAIMLSGN